MNATSEYLERECVVGALGGQRTCPRYVLPCWVCGVLHLLTGTLRSVTEGRLDRFGVESEGRLFDWASADGSESAKLWVMWPDRPAICLHHPAHGKPQRGYWNSDEASAVHT